MRTEIFEVDDENGIAVDDAGRGSRWVTAERFELARAEWAKHAAALRARLDEAESSSVGMTLSVSQIESQIDPTAWDAVKAWESMKAERRPVCVAAVIGSLPLGATREETEACVRALVGGK